MRFLINLSIIVFTFLSCGVSKDLSNASQEINLRDFGAKPNDGQDDAKAFQRALNFINEVEGVSSLRITKGRYQVHRPIRLDNMQSDIFISGEEGVEIIVQNSDFISIWPKPVTTRLRSKAFRNEQKLVVDPYRSLQVGDVVHLFSSSPWEEAWGFTENDIHLVASIDGSHVGLNDKLLFNYEPANEDVQVECYKPYALTLEQLKITMLKRKSAEQRFSAITARAVKLKLRQIIISDASGGKPLHVGVNISRCPEVSFSDMKFQNLEYGFLMNYCRDIVGRNIKAENCRHGIVPTNACVNVDIKNLEGRDCQGVMDSHMSFNVHYDSVTDINATQFSNCRALGVRVTNSTFNVIPEYQQNFSYWSAQGLTPEYRSIYDEYDVYLEHVDWVHEQPTEFNGLAVNSCRNLYVTKCKTHNLSLYGKLSGHALITDSQLGNIRVNSHSVTLNNCVFDGSLNHSTKYVLRLSGKGKTILDSVTVQNYDPKSTFLFSNFYNTSDYNGVTIKNSNIQELKAWTDAMTYPGLKYDGLRIEKSNIERFIDDWPENITIE